MFAFVWVLVATLFVFMGRSLDQTQHEMGLGDPGRAAMVCYGIGGVMALMAAGFVL